MLDHRECSSDMGKRNVNALPAASGAHARLAADPAKRSLVAGSKIDTRLALFLSTNTFNKGISGVLPLPSIITGDHCL